MNELCLLALGGNLPSRVGTPENTLAAALKWLNTGPIRLVSVSRFFQTPCFPAGAGPDYINAAAVVSTALPPNELLQALHHIEAEFGRARQQRWGMRTLDIDLIAADQTVMPDKATQQAWQDLSVEKQAQTAPDQLILPHPRLQDRAFVLGPLCDVAKDWRHPLIGLTLGELYAQLPKTDRDALVACDSVLVKGRKAP